MSDTPKSSPILRLDNALPKKELAKIRDNFSAIVLHEDRLWLGGDEGTSIDLMIRDAAGDFGSHQRFDLEPLLKLPDGTEGEIDIEGLDVDGGYLWLIGSHSLKRNKPDEDDDPEDNIDRLSSIEADGNRFTLGRVPFTNGPDLRPVQNNGGLTAARLEGNARGNLLTKSLQDDPHIGPFVPRSSNGKLSGIPGKDNGFDVEGLAVSGNRAFLGLRGPVLRGWAAVLELQMADSSSGLFRLEALGTHAASDTGSTSCNWTALAFATSPFTTRIYMFWPARRWTSTGRCSSTAGGMRWIRRRTLSLGQRI